MHGAFPPFDGLYREAATRWFAYQAARVEAEGYCRWTRVREVVELARRMGFARIGLPHCPDMQAEAALTARYLRRHGLTPIVPPVSGDCDPRGQARVLSLHGSEFNAIAGMCVGHDALFIRHSQAPVTSLVVRDLRLRHNPVAALYTRTGYFKEALRATTRPASYPTPPALDDESLDRLAREVRDQGASCPDPPCRIAEIMHFARLAGLRHLGVAYCIGFRDEARELHSVLVSNGFTISSICCKSGSVPKEKLGIADDEKVRPGTLEMICNAVAQAELLERAGVELVLLMGQCVGHDSATIAHLRTPAVAVVAKDRVLAHNTVAALYELDRTPAPEAPT